CREHLGERVLGTRLGPGRESFAEPRIARLVVADKRVEPLVRRLVWNENEAAVAEEAERRIRSAVKAAEVLHHRDRIGRPRVVAEATRVEAENVCRRGEKVADRE